MRRVLLLICLAPWLAAATAHAQTNAGLTQNLWQSHQGYVFGFLTALVLQACLIVLLFLQRRKLRGSQSRLRELSARLFTAQEEERARIARELHDDFGQRVAALRIELGMLAREDRGPRRRGLTTAYNSVLAQTDALAADLRDLSHALHSSRLQHLGLRAALEDLCSALDKHRRVSVTLRAPKIAAPVPTDVALCLYRVAQEALHNAAHHGAASQIIVTLAAEGSMLRMQISDTGKGFDAHESSEGFGLASMRERLHTLGGSLMVQSRPGRGTTLTALVDLSQQDAVSRAEIA